MGILTHVIVAGWLGCSEKEADSTSDWDGHVFSVDCDALQDLFVTTSTDSIHDWTGYWECHQENNSCDGEDCSWDVANLPSYVTDEICADAGSCTIDGVEVQECVSQNQTGSVTFDCSTDEEIFITANGLPGHTIENYAQSGSLPPLLGSRSTNTEYSLSASPVYNSDSDVFESGGGTIAVAVNSVSIFNQFTGIGTVAVVDEIVDDCGGHPANGTYHYHAYPICGELATSARKGAAGSHSGLMGMSQDGFPIFGPYGYDSALDSSSEVVRMESCYALTSCDDDNDATCYVFDQEGYDAGTCHLDKCNGRVTAVPSSMQAAFGEEMYAYYTTVDASEAPAFPYLPYCYRGDAASGTSQGPGNGGPPPQ